MNNKKSQGLSLNTIIIAAIVLIVLIVLWAIFTGRMGKFTSGLKTEEDRAKEAAERLGEEAAGGGEAQPASTRCPTGEVPDDCDCDGNPCTQGSICRGVPGSRTCTQ